MIEIDAPQGTDTWFRARAGLATASRFSDILATIKSGEAASRRNYRVQLVVERLTGKIAETFKSAAMLRGTELEPLARAMYESQSGQFVRLAGFCRHNTLEAGASPDGFVGDDGVIEIKAPEASAHLHYLRLPANTAPAEYVAQIQGQLWVCERQFCNFVSLNPDFPERLQLVIRRVERDEAYIAQLALAVELFMGEVRSECAAVEAM